MSLIKIDNISFHYVKEPILSNLTLSIESGVFWAIVNEPPPGSLA